MNLANRITLFRFVLTPAYAAVLFTGISGILPFTPFMVLLWTLFAVSEISDLADGWVARRFDQVTDLGKLMDPFADVIFRITYFYLFFWAGIIPWWPLLIILWREFVVLFIRMLLIKEGTALAAGNSGKIKAFFYFLTGAAGNIYLSLGMDHPWKESLSTLLTIFAIGSALLALISLAQYLWKFIRLQKTPENTGA